MESLRDLYEPLTTPRLELRQPQQDQAPLIFEAFSSDARVTRYLKWQPHRHVTDAKTAMTQRLARLRDSSEFSWVAFRRSTNLVVGILSLWPSPPAAELGFALARSAWGQGLAVEAAAAVLDWALRRARLERVWAACDGENVRSQRVLEKLGMVQERVALGFAIHPNISSEARDCFVYAIATSAG